jgi:hypothetical protein
MAEPVPPAARAGISPAVLVLSVLFAIAATTAVVLALRPSAPAMTLATQADASGKIVAVPVATATLEPFVQKDVVTPKGKTTGQVYYPIPFGSPPNLKFGTSKREYIILTETEFGFTWAARATADDFEPGLNEDATFGPLITNALRLGIPLTEVGGALFAKLKPNPLLDEFTWEAKGIAGKPQPPMVTIKGEFSSLPNTEGEVAFGMSYAQPPNVTFTRDNTGGRTAITTITPTGFKWQNVTMKVNESFGMGTMHWEAKGSRAESK